MTTKIVSDFTKSVITIRWKLAHCIGNSAFVDWDSNKKEFTSVPSSLTYMYYNAHLLTYGGCILQVLLAIYLMNKSFSVENGVLDPVVSTIVAGWVEWGVLCGLSFASYVIKQHRMELNYLCAQIFRYCRQIEENEPMHEFFQDVFEVDVSPKVQHAHILFFVTWIMFSYAGTFFHIMSLAIIYFEFKIVCISSLMPQSFLPHRGQENFQMPEYQVQTTAFGILHETEVVHMYRTQQLFNVLSNNIYASILLSTHQPLLMLIMVGLTFLLVRFFEIVYAAGLFATIMVFTVIFFGFLLVVTESHKLGLLVKISEKFKTVGIRLSRKRSFFRKFARSCPILCFDVAHPFYKITKHTVAEFFYQYLNF
ncbi:unnamed protein product [Orchesella dallaii]|uniref:Odorant receptor n=1 Tax=Orchesella dallaii TaxID=48710 RepID=A0ABP1PLC4_9HEXA